MTIGRNRILSSSPLPSEEELRQRWREPVGRPIQSGGSDISTGIGQKGEATTMKRELLLRVEQDPDAESPRKQDPLGHMVCFHMRHTLGDKHGFKAGDYVGWMGLRDALVAKEKAACVLPLYLMDHSGLAMSTKPFSCPWDSGQVGFVYCTQEEADKWAGAPMSYERIEEVLCAEVARYNQWLRGDVWGYVIEEIRRCPTCGHVEYAPVRSLWGIYGEENARLEGVAEMAGLQEDET